jgi:hypothetical protein
MTKILHDLIQRAQSWPEDAQEELAQIAREIEAGLKGGKYRATPDELRGVDRGLRDSAEGKFVSEADVEAVFAKHRRK